jgi:hypothetical protein
MINQLIYSDITVEGSIINPNVETNDALDNTSPFSFFDFLKYTKGTYTPAEYNTFYTSYLTKWSQTKKTTKPTSIFITEQYIDLLKDISLNYTTEAEKRFISNIDFENPLDLDVALPFYTKKIKEIILFYKQKRDQGTFVIERNKIKGTRTSLERAIYDSIVSYLFSDDGIQNFSLINYNIEQIKQNLEVNIDEFIDVYSNYFDISRTPVDETQLREELYSFNANTIDSDVFFNKSSEVTQQIFGNIVLLKNIPLAVNVILDLNPICSPTNPFEELITQDQQDLLGADNRISLKKKFYQKYLGTDFYYLSTNSTNTTAVSGLLIKADNPSGNLLNLQTVDLAAVESYQLENLRDIGLFFKPDKQGVLKISAQTYQYTIDKSRLQPNKVYIFPDPNVYGNVSTNRQVEYPLVYTFDIGNDIRNSSSGFVKGDPKIDSTGQPIIPYYSRQQNKSKFDARYTFIDMSDLYNQGIIVKWQTDIWGNQYALFKDKFGQYFVKEIDTGNQFIKCLTLDGHLFFDPVEGYNFDYSIYDIVNATTIRSGLTSLTITNSNSGTSFDLSGSPYYLNFRQFTPYQTCGTALTGEYIQYGPLFECGGFTYEDGTMLPDPIHGDLSAYPGSYYYYDYYLAGGVGSITPLNRALIDVPTLSADFTLSLNNYFSSFNAIRYSCGMFTDNIQISDAPDPYLFIDSVDINSQTVVSNLTGNNTYQTIGNYTQLSGAAFVRPVGSTLSTALSTALSAITVKYNDFVRNRVENNLRDFEIIYDSIFLESNNVLIIDKIVYDGAYQQPKTRNTFFVTNSSNGFNKISNKFFREELNNVTFVIMEEFSELSGSNQRIVFPNFYRYTIRDNKTIKIWPKNTYSDVKQLSSYYSLPIPTSGTVLSAGMVSIGKPSLVYNTKNSIWKLTFVGKDLNALAHIFDYTYKEQNATMQLIDSKIYTMTSKEAVTTNWASPSTSYIDLGLNMLTNDISSTYGIYYIQ